MITLNLVGLAANDVTQDGRTSLEEKFAQLQALVPTLPPEVWRTIGSLIELAHIQGLREYNATIRADLSAAVDEINRRFAP